MSEEFFQKRKYDLASLYKLEGELSRLHECLQSWAASPTSGTQDLENRIDRVGKLVQRCCLKKAEDRVEALAKQLTDKAPSEEWHREAERLRFLVEDELTDLDVVRLDWEAIHRDKCLHMERFFNAGVYDRLPLETRLDFQEAGRCFLYEQHRAAVILAFRGAEKMTKEYYHRLTGNSEDKQTFEDMLRILRDANDKGRLIPTVDIQILDKIFDVKQSRNAYMHSGSMPGADDPYEMAGYIDDAAKLCSRLIRDLRERKRLFAVAIGAPIDCDQALTLWMLNKAGDGIGRRFFFTTLREEEQLDMRDVQYKIGGVAGGLSGKATHFTKSSEGTPDCIADRMKTHLKLGEVTPRWLSSLSAGEPKTTLLRSLAATLRKRRWKRCTKVCGSATTTRRRRTCPKSGSSSMRSWKEASIRLTLTWRDCFPATSIAWWRRPSRGLKARPKRPVKQNTMDRNVFLSRLDAPSQTTSTGNADILTLLFVMPLPFTCVSTISVQPHQI